MPLDFPSNPVNGQVYGLFTYDSVNGVWRVQNATSPVIPVRALVIGGGGGASAGISYYMGAGGAGGFIDTVTYLAPGTYTCTVGAGGATLINNNSGQTGNQGNNSVFGPLTAIGGGRGGTDGAPGGVGTQGGSGGGSGWNQSSVAAALGNGQGSAGGRGYDGLSGGGGGAYEAGNTRDISYHRVGGHGRFTDIISTSVATANSVGQIVNFTPLATNVTFFSGGGAGAGNQAYQASGGFGGGGLGGGSWTPTAGTANTGGGGGGSGTYQGGPGGGSGVVIIRLSDRIPVTVGSGLTHVTDTSVSGSVAYIFKSGTGTVTLG